MSSVFLVSCRVCSLYDVECVCSMSSVFSVSCVSDFWLKGVCVCLSVCLSLSACLSLCARR